MYSFTIRNAEGQSKARKQLTLTEADALYNEAIGKARKVIQRNDDIQGKTLVRFAKLASAATTYTVAINTMAV